MSEAIITQKILKLILKYHPTTGLITWLVSNRKQPVLYKNEVTRVTINGRTYTIAQLAFLYMKGYIPIRIFHLKRKSLHDDMWSNLSTSRFKRVRQTDLEYKIRPWTDDVKNAVCYIRYSTRYNKWLVQKKVQKSVLVLAHHDREIDAEADMMIRNFKFTNIKVCELE